MWKIEHDDKNTTDIKLKIGRYNWDSTLEIEKPKSELTLDNEEFHALIDFIENNYKPLKHEMKEFIKIDNKQLFELLEKIKNSITSENDFAKQLILCGIWNKNLSLALETVNRKKALNAFNCDINKNFTNTIGRNGLVKTNGF